MMFLKQTIRRSQRWVLATLLFGTILLSPACVGTNEVDEPLTIGQLPFCDDDSAPRNEISKRLLYVSTLDGKLSALDITKNGETKWSVDTGEPLLSSSIHRLELSTNGKWVRMIPSLSGGLYKFDGETIEAIPIKAEDLLKSSFKFSDDIVISGGIEKNSYGVSTRTGEILYQCSMRGCTNFTAADDDQANKSEHHDALLDDVMIVRRETQTVRAVDPRSGVERWNFSIGQHELELMKSKDCQGGDKNEELDTLLLDLEIRAVIPEGIICAFSKKDPSKMLWMKRFSYPIVSAWKSDTNENVENIDFFSSAEWLWNGQSGIFSQTKKDDEQQVSPSIYLGMYEKQPYIQESNAILQISQEKQYQQGTHIITDDQSDFKFRVPFRPFPANKNGIQLIEDHSEESEVVVPGTTESPPDVPTNALATSVLYASEYVNGNGFFFYTSKDSNKTQNNICDSKNKTQTDDQQFDEADLDFTLMERIHALTFYWNEVVIIILTTAVFVYFFIKNSRTNEREYVVVEKHIPVPFAREAIEGIDYSRSRSSQRSTSESNHSEGVFQSRFATDFDVVQILGKGGFGVVFAVKHKIDDCHYAIKRIVLPAKKESQDRVKREVRTLATCEHQNIVRYFHAWYETPPPGWQEQQDLLMQKREVLSTSIDICETPTEISSLPAFPKSTDNDTKNTNQNKYLLNLNKKPFDMDDLSSVGNSHITNGHGREAEEEETDGGIVFQDNSVSFNDKNYNHHKDNGCDEDVEDSFVVFKNETKDKSKSDKVVVSINGDDNATESQTFSISTDNRKLVPYHKRRRHLSLDLTSEGNVSLPPVQSSRTYLFIQMQLCQKHSLKEWLSKNSYLERKSQVVPIFEQIVGAVEYVHLKGLIHRDLKPSNIFFSLDGQIKIGDFGLVTDMAEQTTPINENSMSLPNTSNKKHTQAVGTTLYMSPEQISGLPYDYKVDIFSLGLILFELYATFNTEMERINTLKAVRSQKFPEEFKQNFNNEYELLKLMLSENPDDRPTTIGIRARPPLLHQVSNGDEYHFELPPRQRRESHNSNNQNSTFLTTESIKGNLINLQKEIVHHTEKLSEN
ncbi:eukaryotic translation initiation factor 2-alpha kinase [Culicoides brevitarsis]|uniref:eukaryotic translation initiation factor 2-alpha kinase n=1 Tax=Culicoides brevitarsis TaxID=469753 RepID=UPI00307B2950